MEENPRAPKQVMFSVLSFLPGRNYWNLTHGGDTVGQSSEQGRGWRQLAWVQIPLYHFLTL